MNTITSNNNIKNKGKGAGGANTNKNGLSYEALTDLDDRIKVIRKDKFSYEVVFSDNCTVFTKTKQSNLFKCMYKEADNNIRKAHGCKNPDECYINRETKTIFIIEKKFQQCNGSVCEKIQTPDFKIWQYSRTFPEYRIVYVYCLSSWFRINCIPEIEYLDFKGVKYFWGDSDEYKDDIINFMLNYK